MRAYLIFAVVSAIVTQCASDARAAGTRTSRGAAGGERIPLPERLSHASTDEMVAMCRSNLRQIEDSNDSGEMRRELFVTLRLMRRKGLSPNSGLFQEMLSRPSLPSYIREEALRGIFRDKDGPAVAKQWLVSNDDRLRAVAIDLLAPAETGDPAIQKTIKKMVKEKLKYSQTYTGVSLVYVEKMYQFREMYLAEKSFGKRLDMLVLYIGHVCAGPLSTAEGYHLEDTAISQYVLDRFKEAYAIDSDAVVAAVNKVGERDHGGASIGEFVLGLLRETSAAGEGAEVSDAPAEK